MLTRFTRAVLALMVVVSTAGATAALAASGLHGTVVDQTGAVVPAAAVDVVNNSSGTARRIVTNERGEFSAEGLPAGRYTVSASSGGFTTATQSDVMVADGADPAVVLTLSVARQEARVEIKAVVGGAAESLTGERPASGSAVALLDGLPGVSIAANGGVSGLPALHGLADDRVKVNLNGMTIASACSTHMNPPLSNIDPANLASIKVMAGITPVSAGGDSIGGSIVVESARPAFAAAGVTVHGSASAYTRTNSDTVGGSASFSAATDHLRIGYIGSYVNAGNYTAGGGEMVKSTFYTSANHAVQLALSRGARTLTADFNVQRIPEQGFANARMDMTRNDATSLNVRYESLANWGRIDARGYAEQTTHEMNILRDKIPGMNMPMNTKGSNTGYSLAIDRRIGANDTIRVGSDLHRFHLDDWWPAAMAMMGSMGPDTLQTINNGRRLRVGTFGEWEGHRGIWTTVVGLRSDIVSMNTGNVAGYNMSQATTGSAAYYADAVDFNAREHARRDYNVDATATAKAAPTDTTSFEFGYARKTRSPNLYERYLWVRRSNMAVQMNGWFGDANGYSGNLDLRPEVAHTVSATAGWHSVATPGRELLVTPYVTRVNDYIDVDRCGIIAGSNGCTAAKLAATSGFVNLQFANHEARLYGADLSGRTPLGGTDRMGRLSLTGVASYVRGRVVDTSDNLYRLMPLNGRLTLEHRLKGWTSSVGVEAVTAKTRVQAVRNELTTAGYALVNVRTGYQFRTLRLDLGIDNVADRRYVLPMGGRYWIGDTTGATGLPGVGRSLSVGVTARL